MLNNQALAVAKAGIIAVRAAIRRDWGDRIAGDTQAVVAIKHIYTLQSVMAVAATFTAMQDTHNPCHQCCAVSKTGSIRGTALRINTTGTLERGHA